MDVHTKEQRSKNMAAIKSGNTKPEIIVRKLLFSLGYRYKLNNKDLPGKPDIKLSRYKTVIFVHGCFWHQHKDCKYAVMPKTNREFWENKLGGNVKRDAENKDKLLKMGWKVLIIWECQLKDLNKLADLLKTNLK
ncbi:MAG TPA: very short patch repair endonuclease [Candidatus Gastranaerophilales bacterium]|nr:very short patch repair endonuclease [Candidatus Gastranaerophilales bacterium]